ncbi:hypothetical protein QWT69_04755 [Sporosarcina oncorhynchi]|uniref:Sporulation lipoprotein YhcN/YlaJ (Spore_YhcN_YlaJ) n=1 Tax=Sporosarcina oncorhynchi TaxID=3056444 RepID=A0ABZ0L798_9BACL|nr:hypothetical protein [Sporosarcina sp. T2O-4]WOV88434.1 hypothetical protein QWT69_04755 [Sporosarcina sp. T2O-4]
MFIIRHLLLILSLVLLLAGCVPNEFRIDNRTDLNSSQAEELIKDDNRIKGAAALFYEDHLIAGIRVKTFSRFNKRKIATELEKSLKEVYPDLSILVSADSKILTETTKLMLEKEDENVKEDIHELIDLVEEET